MVLGPRGSPRLVLFGDTGPAGVRDMVGGSVGFSVWFALVVFFQHDLVT